MWRLSPGITLPTGSSLSAWSGNFNNIRRIEYEKS
jgi:hypothetical protein